ncbi:peptidase 1 [Thelephora ganbajun]|uniref:Peptidase 1 n=1 Tax=Thelephora ganbajun TaxID=370292 RepID=A0ACB6ZSF6_THEGA|nr:peptidase 1 [Thelephora ganbajun]
MRSINAFLCLALLALPVLASEELLPVKRAEGEVLKDSYVVLLNDGPGVESMDTIAQEIPSSNITDRWSIVNGFAATLTEEDLTKLRARKDILSISENASVKNTAKQTNAPWGLQRISHREPVTPKDPFLLTYTYIYDDSAGAGVDIYIIDTGIQIDHPAFGGRAHWGATLHGTHCAGTAASQPFGVSKAANLIAVKVLGDGGFGWWSDVISGVDWVATHAASTGRPSVASMSLGGGAFDPVDLAVANLVASGVPTAVAAGNWAEDAKFFSPARTPSAITVAAMDITDFMAYFSNYGSIVDIFGPGVNVWSTWSVIGSSTNIISGTSMATPHVSGFVAYLLGMDPSLSAAAIEATIDCYSTKDVLTLTTAG